MRAFCSLFVLIGILPISLQADYNPYDFFEIIGGAEIVVSGTIESLNEKTYVLRIDRVLGGQYTHPTIEIAKFADWPCAWRYGPYAPGQSLAAFLIKADHLTNRAGRVIYKTLGADTASECPIQAGFVYCQLGVAAPESMRASIGRLDHRTKVPLDEFSSAIVGYRSLYRLELGAFQRLSLNGHDAIFAVRRIERLNQLPALANAFRPRHAPPDYVTQLNSLARKSWLHRHLVDSTELAAAFLKVPSVGWKLQFNDRETWPVVRLYQSTDIPQSR